MIFVGLGAGAAARALLRLDNDGQPVPLFGNRGDGFVEPRSPRRRWRLIPTARSSSQTAAGTPTVVAGVPRGCSACWRMDSRMPSSAVTDLSRSRTCTSATVRLVLDARADGSVIVGDGDTIVAIDAVGDIDRTFGVDGRLSIHEIAWPSDRLLPDGGLLIFGLNDVAPMRMTPYSGSFDRNGQPDLDFGPGTGSVTVDLGADLLERAFRLRVCLSTGA